MRLQPVRGKNARGQVGELAYSGALPLFVVLQDVGLVCGQPALDQLVELLVRLAPRLVPRPVRSLTLFGAVVVLLAARTDKEVTIQILAILHAALARLHLFSAFACCNICIWEG
jgi:hypothetical protein